jgi:hypothetical protein
MVDNRTDPQVVRQMERHPDTASSPGFRADPPQPQNAPRRNWLHRLAISVVAVVVLAVAAGTFFLSYPGVHAIARQGGVSGQLARFYPALFDAVLVIACVAAVMLRDARWWARCWAWLVAIVVLGAIGAADVLHAMSYGLRQRPTEGVVAAAPVAAVLLAFSLFLTMLRQSRPQPPAQSPAGDLASGGTGAPMMYSSVEVVPGLAAGAGTRPPAPPIALPAAAAEAPDAPDAPAPDTQPLETVPTQEIPVVAANASDDGPDARAAAVTEAAPADPATPTDPTDVTDVTDVTDLADQSSDPAHPATEENEAVEPQAPTAAEPTATPEAATPEAATEVTPEPSADTPETPETLATSEQTAAEEPDAAPDEPEPAEATRPTPHGIRYASSAAAEQFGDEDWEAEVDPALAGQVYPVLTSDPDIEVPPHQPGQSQDLEDDAPPFATAPFASVPRLNRVRVTPTPPTDDDADED